MIFISKSDFILSSFIFCCFQFHNKLNLELKLKFEKSFKSIREANNSIFFDKN